MGAGIMEEEVFAQVRTLNQMFRPETFNNASNDGTRNVIQHLRAHLYLNLLSHGGTSAQDRQGSLWFAASVLTPYHDLGAQPHYPARTFRRWLRWLIWLRKYQQADHDRIIDAINVAINDTPSGSYLPSIHWAWH